MAQRTPSGPAVTADFRRNESGASLAEFALILPILLIMLFGIVEFGIAFNRAQAIEAGAREGARLASLQSTTQADINNRVNATLAGIPFDSSPVIAAASPALCAGRAGEAVTVVVTADHDVNIPPIINQTITLTGQAVFRCEG